MTDIVNAVLDHRSDPRAAIIGEDRTTSYAELVELTHRLAGGLQRVIGDRDLCVVVSLPGLVESLGLTLAGWSIGKRVAVLPPYLKDGELDHAIGLLRPVLIVSEQPSSTPDSVALEDLLSSTGQAGTDVRVGRLQTFTSGTTGHPKCVDRPAGSLSDDILQFVETTGLRDTDRVTAMTTALSTTSVLPALVAGATLVSIPMRSPGSFWSSVTDGDVTVLSGTPYSYELAVRRTPDRESIRAVRFGLSTSARLRPSTARSLMEDTGIPIHQVFCSSESGHVAFNGAPDLEGLVDGVGTPFPDVEVQIRSVDGEVLPAGQPGLVCVRSPFTATGYRNNPEASEEVFRDDGWVVSTDVGHLDVAGVLRLTGRHDHRIHFGAAKLDPQELEDVLLRHPDVQDVIVVGEDHDRLGQVPVARVVPSRQISSSALIEHCRKHLSATKLPQKVEFVREIEKDFKGQPVRPKYVTYT